MTNLPQLVDVSPGLMDTMAVQEITIDGRRDREFIDMLQLVGIASEIDEAMLVSITDGLLEARVDVRRMDILERYYTADGDEPTSSNRVQADRFMFHRATDSATAHDLVARISMVVPEVRDVALQRIGGKDGPLVLRSGEQCSAITDDETEISEQGTVSVKSIVRAFNRLIAHTKLKARFVPLVSDDDREIYVAMSKEGMLALARGGCIEPLPMAAIDDFAAW